VIGDWRRTRRAGVELNGSSETVPISVSATTAGGALTRVGHLGERDAAPTGLELLFREGAYVPRFLSPTSPHLMLDATVDLEPISSSA
jgi:hypothetical protein